MNLLGMAADLFKQQLGGAGDNLDISTITDALSGLLGADNGEIDLAGLMSKVQGSGLAGMAASWLGNGENEAISVSEILGMFGSDQVNDFASKLDLDQDAAAEGLAGMIPSLIDQQSEGGNLMGAASSVLGKFF